MHCRFTSLLAIAPALLALTGCSPVCISGCTANTATLRTRAAFDLDCPEDQLKLTQLNEPLTADGTVYGVSGCGKRSTYVSEGAETWILNTDEKPAAPAPDA